MRTGRTGTIVIVWLLAMLVADIAVAGKELPPLEGYVEGKMQIVGAYPKVDETFEVVYEMKVSGTADWTQRENDLTNDYVVVIRCIPSGREGRPPQATEVVGQDRFFFSGLKIGETKEFRTRCRILKPVTSVNIVGELDLAVQGKSYGPVVRSGEIWLSLLDPATGQYVPEAEWRAKSINVFWKYNNLEPQWLSEPTQEWVEGNQKIAGEMKSFEPALTDSEALCLHRDNYLLIINGIGDPNATDSGRVVHLLNAGWLKAQRAGAREHDKWLNDFMGKNRGRWGGDPDSYFFRGRDPDSGDSSRSDNSSLEEPPTTTFVGQWLYGITCTTMNKVCCGRMR